MPTGSTASTPSVFHPICVGSRTLPGNLALAPMAGATDAVFRRICREQGASLVCTELVSARGIRHDPGLVRSWKYLEILPGESPAAIQLFGADPTDFDYAIHAILEHPLLCGAFAIDINMGCPVPKVVSTGGGSALMRDLPLASRILRASVRAASSFGVPVTVKFRTGWDARTADTPAFARMAEDSGAAMLTVHARTRDMMYSGQADWSVVRAVKSAVGIPVFGNGDVRDAQSAVDMLLQTGADGAAIGRAALGDPWIFARASAAMKGLPVPPLPEVSVRAAAALRELAERAVKYGEDRAVREMRKSFLWYLRGAPHSADLRRRAAEVSTVKEAADLMSGWVSANSPKIL